MTTAVMAAIGQQTTLDRSMAVVANNAANGNTTAFQQSILNVQMMQASLSDGSQIYYPEIQGTWRDLTQGGLRDTGDPLHFALMGRGYFAVQTPEGVGYTRRGTFRRNEEGVLVTEHGLPVLSDAGEIAIPATAKNISVTRDGLIDVDGEVVGKLLIAQFKDEQLLAAKGNGVFTTDAEVLETVNVSVVQGSLEMANVDMIRTIVQLAEVTSGYKRNQQIIDAEHESEKKTLEKLGNA